MRLLRIGHLRIVFYIKWLRETQPPFADIGGQARNRTKDTGIFRACKINNLLIILEQAVFGTVRLNHAVSIG